MKKNTYWVGILLAFMPLMVNAGAINLLDSSLRTAITGAMGGLQTTAILWLSSFVLIQFLITNIGLLKSGADIEAVLGKLLGSLLWFGFCFYVMLNGADFIDSVSKGFFNTAGNISGAGQFNAGYIIDQGATLAGNLLGKINNASGITDLFMPSLLGGLLGLVIMATAALIAFKVFLIKIETMLIIMMSPLSFSFLGLNALKDQGIAPFKSLISLLYRIIFLALILKTMGGMSDNLVTVINSITEDSIDGIWSVVFAAVIGYVLLAFLAFKSDSLASSLASGSTNFGTADVATAAAIGAAVGGAVGTGGAAVGGATAKGGQSMGDFMKSLGGSSSVSNASASGTGGSESKPVGAAPTPPAKKPEMSMSEMRNHPAAIGNQSKNSSEGASSPASSGSGSASPASSNSGSAATKAANTIDNLASSGQLKDTATAKHVSDHLKSMGPSDAQAVGESPSAPTKASALDSGSGSSAGIGGEASQTDQKMDKLLDMMGQPNKGQTLGDRLSTLNDHVAKEQAATHVSINTHHSD